MDGTTRGCFPNVNYVAVKNNTSGAQSELNIDQSPNPRIALVDGMAITAPNTEAANYILDSTCNANGEGICGVYWVDINGFKNPNEYGYDTFAFYLTRNGIVPAGTQKDSYSGGYSFEYMCIGSGSYVDESGLGCTGWVINNENFDFRKPCGQTLDWTNKRSCN